eukprot:6263300-Prymnesium_polylepis.1
MGRGRGVRGGGRAHLVLHLPLLAIEAKRGRLGSGGRGGRRGLGRRRSFGHRDRPVTSGEGGV